MRTIVLSENTSLVTVRTLERNRIVGFIQVAARDRAGRFASLVKCLVEHWPQRQMAYLFN